MVRVRFAQIATVAALAGSLAACGSSSPKAATAPVTVTSTVQAAPASSTTTTPASSAPSSTQSSSEPSAQPTAKSSSTGSTGSNGSTGGGVANAGDKVAIVGTLQYLAPGKFLVHPDDGSTDQGFYVSDSTQILGAAVICGPASGNVTIGSDGYGTSKCTEDQLETAAKKNYVKVRVTMDRKTGDVATVEEKYHP